MIRLGWLLLCAAVGLAQEGVVGDWHGAIEIGGGALDIEVQFTETDAGLQATMDIPQQRAEGLDLENVWVEGDSVRFELHAPVGIARFEGLLGEDGMRGSFSQAGMPGSFWLRRGERPERELYSGSLVIAGRTIDANLRLFEDSVEGHVQAWLDFPGQGAFGLALEEVAIDSTAVHFELVGPAGRAVFDGTVDGDDITGTFEQAGLEGSFAFRRGAEEAGPVPYLELEVSWQVAFDTVAIRLAGTLTLPEGPGPFPAVVMISGSGAQDRDEDIFGFKIFRDIADALTRRGIAVLRYDDPGVGGSSSNQLDLTTLELVEPVLGAVEWLSAREEIGAVGLAGHSEGGIVAPLAAVQDPRVAFCILLAGPATTGGEILQDQVELIMTASGAEEADIARALELQRDTVAALEAGDEAELEALIRTAVAEQWADVPDERRDEIEDFDAYLDELVAGQLKAVRSRWFRTFVSHDPRPTLEQLSCPVLGLFGEVDLQVPAEKNRAAMAEALEKAGNTAVTLRILDGANHLFAPSETGNPTEYATMEQVFVEGFLEQLGDWILEVTE